LDAETVIVDSSQRKYAPLRILKASNEQRHRNDAIWDQEGTQMSKERPAKVGIIGAGSVGATIAYAALIRGVAPQISLFDI
jgi:pyruvate/2-oxoglutarate dehydrogenase complex dihydrolipoamide dehydrogenase (E3) component